MSSGRQTEPAVRDILPVIGLTMAVFMGAQVLTGGSPAKPELLLLELSVAVPALVYCLVKKYPLGTAFRMSRSGIRCIPAALVIALGMKPFFDEVNVLIEGIFPMPVEISAAISRMMTWDGPAEAVLLFAALVPAAGLAEEVLFRGFIQGTLERAGNVTRAVAVAALIFALMHFNPWWFIEILLMGVLLGVMARRSGTVIPAAAAHALYNFCGLVMANTNPEHLEWYTAGSHIAPAAAAAGALLMYGGFCWLYRLTAAPVTG